MFLGWRSDTPDNDEIGYWRYSTQYLDYVLQGHPEDPSEALSYWWPPVVPGVLALWRSLVGDSVFLARLLMHVFAALLPLAVWWWGRKLLSETGARLAALVAVVDPYMAVGSGRLESDHLFTLLLIVVLLSKDIETRSPLLTGIFCGLLAWVRTATLFMVPFVALEIWRRRNFKTGASSLALLIMGYALALSPLMIRNRVLVGEWFLAPYKGFVLLVANNPNHAEAPWVVEGQGLHRAITYNPTSSKLVPDNEQLQLLPFLERDAIYNKRAKEWLGNHPLEFPLNAVHRVLGLFHFYPPAHPDLKRIVPLAAMTLLILMSFAGIILTWKDPAFAWCRIVLWATILTAALTMVIPRYRFPLHPVFYITAVVFLQSRFPLLRQSS